MTGPKLSGCRCQCAACGEYFGSERAFDRHRVGDYAAPGHWQGTRGCLSLSAMLADGWVRNGQGFLLTPDPRRAGAGIQGPHVTPTATWVQGVGP